MSPGTFLVIVAIYSIYSCCIYGIERLFAGGHPIIAGAATIGLHVINWLVAATATSGHAPPIGDRLWLLLGAVIPFAGGAGLVIWGGADSNRMAGGALMLGTIVPTVLFLGLLIKGRSKS